MKPTARRRNIAGQMPLISLIVLCAATALLTSRFLSPLNLTNILVQSSIMAVIAMGMTFVIVGGGFDLSVGSIVALLPSRFLSPLNLTNILVQSSIMAVIAMGMTFVIVGGGFDLSVGSIAALSGCIAGMVMLKFGIA